MKVQVDMTARGRWRAGGGALAALMLSAAMGTSGCARFSPDGGMLVVEAAASSELGKEVVKIRDEADAAAVSARVKALLVKPLTASSAVQIALINNRALQAAYNELGISEAEMVEASLPPAPTVSFLRIVGSGGFEIERQIVQNVLGLLTLPRRREIAEARFRQAQARAVEMTLRTAMEAARSYYRATAANELVRFLQESRLSAEAVSDLAKQLGETGAMSKLEQAREHVFYAEVSGQVAMARLRQRGERERLIRALGLWGNDTTFRLPDRLTALPPRPRSLTSIERDAVGRRVDLVIARMELDILALQLGLTRKRRFINTLEAAGISKTEKDINPDTGEADKIKRRGFELAVEIPIYDFGEARVRGAEETYMQAVNRLLERAVNVRSEAREAYQMYRGAYDIARHYEREVLPLRKIISDETMLNYNAMIKDLFALLAEARARISANSQSIEARRDFWLASVDLHAAIVGGRGGEQIQMPSAITTVGGQSAEQH
jgi:outer membrane protein TolC